MQSVILCAAAEVATLREAVKTVRDAAEALQAASDEAQKPMQRLNLREARSILVSCLILWTPACVSLEMVYAKASSSSRLMFLQARRLEQLSPQCSSGVCSSAASEATMLLISLDAMLESL